MSLKREKRFSIGGIEVGIATDIDRVERIRRNPLYRHLIKPGLDLVRKRRHPNGKEPSLKTRTPEIPRPAAPTDPKAAAIWEKISDIRWYHTIDLGNGVVTPGFIDNRTTMHLFGLPDDLTGKRCLDIGTYDGFWAFEMERRGASEVIGIDVDSPADHDMPRLVKQRAIDEGKLQEEWDKGLDKMGLQWPGAGFHMAKEILGSKARREAINVYDLHPDKVGKFDVMIISQLLLRLRDPQTVLENMFSVCKGIAIVGEPYDADLETLSKPVSEFIGTQTMGVWWSHSIKSMKKMMEVAGFDPVEEVSRFKAENRAGQFTKVILRGYVPGVDEPAQAS